MYTEEQAKGKWCSVSEHNYCGGSGCMAWRWLDHVDNASNRTFCAGHALTTEPLENTWNIPEEERRGFCGLAGRPI